MKKNSLIVFLILGIVILVFTGCENKENYSNEETVQSENTEEKEESENGEKKSLKNSDENINYEDLEIINDGEPIFTNLKVGEDGEAHVIKGSFSIGVDVSNENKSKSFIDEINKKYVIVKDVIIGVLRGKTYEQLSISDAQSLLREEIKNKLCEEFDTNLIKVVYINDLYIDSNTKEGENKSLKTSDENINYKDLEIINIDESIYTNLKVGEDGEIHVMRGSFNIGVDVSNENKSKSLIDEINTKQVIVKDVIIGVLRDKTYEQLITSDAQSLLREKIKNKLCEEFDTNLIKKIYIDDLFFD